MPDTSFYPPNPQNVSPSLTMPAASFKTQVIRVIGAILLFCLVYLILLSLALGLGFLCITAGFYLITHFIGFWGLLLGLGVIALGAMVVFFLIKFIFAGQDTGNSNRVQIFEKDHPRLFAFIRQLTMDTNTPMPKKVFVVPDVNAAVFYDSTFRSMFMPVKKNLEIGLGLVNVLNLSEFKMVLAHEFGHFSQRSMKLGTYVFSVHKAIYNMLYQNEGYDKTLGFWAELHAVFAILAHVTVWIAKGIQAVLREMYGIITLQYRSLSREMEFHADAVAVSVTGSDIASSALRRIEFVSNGMNYCVQKTAELAQQQSAMRNMFDTQRKVNLFFANVNQIEVENGLPKINNECLSKFSSSRLRYKDQWATHPSLEDREERFQQAAIANGTDQRSPWILFDNPAALEEQLTRHYVTVNFPGTEVKETVESETLVQKVHQYYELYEFPPVYNGFYDNRTFARIDSSREVNTDISFDTLYGTETVHRIKKYFQDQQDLAYLKAFEKKEIDVKHFEFDQRRYSVKDVTAVISGLEKEIADSEKWLLDTDHAAFHFHQREALAAGEQEAAGLKGQYEEVLALQDDLEKAQETAGKVIHRLNYIYSGQQFTREGLIGELDALKIEEEPFRDELRKLVQSGIVETAIDEQFNEDAMKFLDSRPEYFQDDQAQGTLLVALYELCNRTMHCFGRAIELKKKYYLEKAQQVREAGAKATA